MGKRGRVGTNETVGVSIHKSLPSIAIQRGGLV